MRTLKSLILFICISIGVTFFCTSCSDVTEEANSSTMAKAESLRNNFLEGKEYLFKKSDFSNLPVSDKAALWNEKLNQLIAQDFPVEHLYLLKQIKVEYEKAVLKQDNKMKELILDLAIITPENDFSIMLLDLGDYSYVGFKQEKINPAFYNYLESCDYYIF